MHAAKDVPLSENNDGEGEAGIADSEEGNCPGSSQAIDFLTGRHYRHTDQQNTQTPKRDIHCPWPNAFGQHLDLPSSSSSHPSVGEATTQHQCAFMFSRAYDLARHLHAEHAVHELDMDGLVAWVAQVKRNRFA